MSLKVHNTMSGKKELFEPIDAKNVRMYVCGPTVYDYAHIGNARPYVVFDLLYRLLRREYGESHVTYARNITDIDDKIMARAAEEGKTVDAAGGAAACRASYRQVRRSTPDRSLWISWWVSF